MKRRWFPVILLVFQVIGAALVIAYCIASGGRQITSQTWLALMFVGGGIVTSSIPMSVIRAGSKAEFSAGLLFVVAGAMALPTQAATLSIGVGIAVGWALRRDFQLTRLQDTACDFIAIFISVSVAHLIGGVGLRPQDILGAVAAAFIYDPLTLLFVIATIWMSKDIHPLRFAWDCMSPVLPAYPFLIACGVLLGALAVDNTWALPLTTAPLALIFLASKSRVDATEDRARLDGLLSATTTILEAATIDAVTVAAVAGAAKLFEGHGGRLDTEPPRDGELGARLHVDEVGDMNLITGSRGTLMVQYTEQDQRLLETLASITASAMSKAFQHEAATVQATIDPLTGLANRRSFEERVSLALASRRSGDGSGVIFVDLDRFKQINDEHGHQAGDEVLVEAARRLSAAVRGGDMVARLGGDEFTILLRGVHSADDAILVAERVLSSMRLPIVLSSGVEVGTTPSIGIALAIDPGDDPVQLVKDADAAMYEAKRAGKDCWRIATTPPRVVAVQ